MLQSQQCWLPILHEPISLNKLWQSSETLPKLKFIAHCEDENKKEQLINKLVNQSTNRFILIGPEGDFTKKEIDAALQNNFIPVALGETRLRTETAGIVAATLLCNI
jgi:16S rRNA (uracil1498-N3)-methyltransferase